MIKFLISIHDKASWASWASWASAIASFLAVITAVCLAFWGNQKDKKRRTTEQLEEKRKFSVLGTLIIGQLLEEVETGLRHMRQLLYYANSNISLGGQLPQASWQGQETIPNEVLLVIYEKSRNFTSSGFPVQEIRIHCKNYFVHMVNRVNMAVSSQNLKNLIDLLDNNQGQAKYIEATEGVITMLKESCRLLEDNANEINRLL
jgi:hypothetical protein